MWRLIVFFGIFGLSVVPQNDVDYTSMFLSKFVSDDEMQSRKNSASNRQVSKKDIKIFFYNKDSKDQELNIRNAEEVRETQYSPEKDTVFIIHGWSNDHTSRMCTVIKNAYIKAADMNVFVVDWSRVAMEEYITARYQVVQVGHVLAKMISIMVTNKLLSLNKTSIVAHSLGAHVAGTTGKALHGQIHHIVGLDPAGPLFSLRVTRDRLAKSDAKFVQVIHTASGILGFESSLGHADYWANGGHEQVGCINEIIGFCSHDRAYFLYADSLISGKFYSKRCQNYKSFRSGACRNCPESYFGGLHVNMEARGDFYFDTNAVSPFAKKTKWIAEVEEGQPISTICIGHGNPAKFLFKGHDIYFFIFLI